MLSKGRASAIIVLVGFFILLVALLASMARPGTPPSTPCKETEKQIQQETETTTPVPYLSTTNETFPWKDIRLPRSILPKSYDIEFMADFDNQYFEGKVDIRMNVVEATNYIILHVKDLNVSNVEISSTKEHFNIIKQLEYVAHQQLYLKTDKMLNKGAELHLLLSFRGSLVKKLMGFYLSSYKTPDGTTR